MSIISPNWRFWGSKFINWSKYHQFGDLEAPNRRFFGPIAAYLIYCRLPFCRLGICRRQTAMPSDTGNGIAGGKLRCISHGLSSTLPKKISPNFSAFFFIQSDGRPVPTFYSRFSKKNRIEFISQSQILKTTNLNDLNTPKRFSSVLCLYNDD